MVPVIATILHDYILVVEREKQKADCDRQRNPAKIKSNGPRSARLPRDMAQEQPARTSFLEHQILNSDVRQARRQAPPPSLDIAQSFTDRFNGGESSQGVSSPTAPPPPPAVFTSPPERTTFGRPSLQTQHRSHDGRHHSARNANIAHTSAASTSENADTFSLRPVRDVDRLPSMVPLTLGITSNPESPTTPSAPLHQRGMLSPAGQRLRRPSIRQQLSTDDVHMDDVNALTEDAIAEQEARDDPDQMRPNDGDLTPRAIPADRGPLTLTIPGTLPPEQDNVDIAQQTPTTATVLESLLPQTQEMNGNSPAVNGPQPLASPVVPLNPYSNFLLRNPSTNPALSPLKPRDDDVLMGLQLLAYISKYCDLRHYFQATHLVPRLRIDREVEKVFGPTSTPLPEPTEDEMEEYLQPDDVNIFPLVEKFTIPHHSKEMQYWACVVMRNLCRKDDARGGTRQCANYKCGKWEDYPRQFAKCRRCKRTKYCSKECQRDSWSMHRHWCQISP